MPYDTHACFYVRRFDGNAEQISNRLELTPTRTWLKGEPGPLNRPRGYSNWELHSSLPSTQRLQDHHLQDILALLEGRRTQILSLAAKCECGIQCVGYCVDEDIKIRLDSQLISRIAALDLPVGFDLYCGCLDETPEA